MHKVLLVEDDLTMLTLLSTLLEIEGFQPVKLDNYSDVIEKVRVEQPDLVLLDVHLKEANGFDVLEGLRQDGELKSIPVIMSSGADFSSKCLEKGASDFIMKPYMPDELIAKIKHWLLH